AKGLGGWFKARGLRSARGELKQRADALWEAFDERYPDVVGAVRGYFQARSAWAEAQGRAQSWLGRRLFPRLSSVFYAEARTRLAADEVRSVEEYEQLRAALRGKDEDERGLLLFAYGAPIFNGVAPLPALHAAVAEQIDAVRREE